MRNLVTIGLMAAASSVSGVRAVGGEFYVGGASLKPNSVETAVVQSKEFKKPPHFLTKIGRFYKTDRYMGGVIKPDIRGKACECGGVFHQTKLDDFINAIPVCNKCQKKPELFRIRITLPGSPKKDIRYNFEGQRLTKASLADATLSRVRDEIKSGKFDPLIYMNAKGKQELLFSSFSRYYFGTREKEKISPEGLRNIESLNRTYLNPYFGDLYVYDITSGLIKKFELDWVPVGNAKTTRQRDKCLEQLHAILTLAKSLEIIRAVPNFPKISRSKRKTSVIDTATQEQILANVKNLIYQAAMRLMRKYMARTSEIRSLKWCDIDRKNGVLHFRRHYSNKVEIPGRKSISDPDNDFFDHTPPLDQEFFDIIRDIPESINRDDYLFKTDTGKPLYESALRKAWNRTVKQLNLPRIDMYSGLKRSRAQDLSDVGAHPEDLRILMGQTTMQAAKHYHRQSAKNLKGVVEGLQAKLDAKKIQENQADNA